MLTENSNFDLSDGNGLGFLTAAAQSGLTAVRAHQQTDPADGRYACADDAGDLHPFIDKAHPCDTQYQRNKQTQCPCCPNQEADQAKTVHFS